ncbi:hypothetical protein [Brevundimonas sp.]|jgi:translation initiation factor IF-1|uniref:hypothetical protein n=1 Tax=Brevundimonas sp. TaxID=1871086 RepID=UPI002E0D3E00|nr:hypothetical protein [Brevundimonas sp.]
MPVDPGRPAPATSPEPIAFEGEVVGLLPLGLRRVRLTNGHMVTVLPPRGKDQPLYLVGDAVNIEIAFNQLRGWRLKGRRP